MSNETKQTAVEQFAIVLYENGFLTGNGDEIQELLEKARAMQKQQAEHYATFITNCVINNLPTITFNDWINLHNNEQQ
jgi:hypothetical protein